VRETTLPTPRSVKREGEEMLQISPAAHDEDHGEAGCPLQPMEVHGGADIHPQSMEDPRLEQVGAP